MKDKLWALALVALVMIALVLAVVIVYAQLKMDYAIWHSDTPWWMKLWAFGRH